MSRAGYCLIDLVSPEILLLTTYSVSKVKSPCDAPCLWTVGLMKLCEYDARIEVALFYLLAICLHEV